VLKIICPDDEEEISKHFCDRLSRVGGLAISRDDAESTIEVIDNLENFAKSTAEKGLRVATVAAARSLLGRVIESAMEKGLEKATQQAVGSLAALTILSEETVKAVIQNYKSKEGQDLVSFHKFSKIYEQELLKLQAKKN
jgi:hypothetical protein